MTRLRVVGLPGPGGRYLLVLDRHSLGEQDTQDPDLGVRTKNELDGCAGILVFADQVEVE